MYQSDLLELKYVSEAKPGMSLVGLTSIMNVSTASNELFSVTGILFFDKGYFGQILEGNLRAVSNTWSRIKNDSRHTNIELLDIKEIEERRFPKWSMKLFDPQEFSIHFPQFGELNAKIDDPDLKTLETLRMLWREI
jgi:hypothetical protein